MRKIIILLLSILIVGCLSNNDAGSHEVVVQDLSKYAVDIGGANRDYLRQVAERSIVYHKDKDVLTEIMGLAQKLYTLSMLYVEQSGGISQSGFLMVPSTRGEHGIKIYESYELRKKLKDSINRIERGATTDNADLI